MKILPNWHRSATIYERRTKILYHISDSAHMEESHHVAIDDV